MKGGFIFTNELIDHITQRGLKFNSKEYFSAIGTYIMENSTLKIISYSSLSGIIFSAKLNEAAWAPFAKYTVSGHVFIRTYLIKACMLTAGDPVSYYIRVDGVGKEKSTDLIEDFVNECSAQFDMFDKSIHYESIIPACISREPIILDPSRKGQFLQSMIDKTSEARDKTLLAQIQAAKPIKDASLGYFIMEFAEGYNTIGQLQGNQDLAEIKVVGKTGVMILAMMYGVIHGDIHMGNVMVKHDPNQGQFFNKTGSAKCNYSVKVIDFGRYVPVSSRDKTLRAVLKELMKHSRLRGDANSQVVEYLRLLLNTKLGDDKYPLDAQQRHYRDWLKSSTDELKRIWEYTTDYFAGERAFYKFLKGRVPSFPERPNNPAGSEPVYKRFSDLNKMLIDQRVDTSRVRVADAQAAAEAADLKARRNSRLAAAAAKARQEAEKERVIYEMELQRQQEIEEGISAEEEEAENIATAFSWMNSWEGESKEEDTHFKDKVATDKETALQNLSRASQYSSEIRNSNSLGHLFSAIRSEPVDLARLCACLYNGVDPNCVGRGFYTPLRSLVKTAMTRVAKNPDEYRLTDITTAIRILVSYGAKPNKYIALDSGFFIPSPINTLWINNEPPAASVPNGDSWRILMALFNKPDSAKGGTRRRQQKKRRTIRTNRYIRLI